jgi:hypothetical protein
MTPAIREIKARIDAHKANRPDSLKALHPNAPLAIRSAYREWSKAHEILQSELSHAEWQHRSAWKNANGEIIRPYGWQSTGQLLAPSGVNAAPDGESAAGKRMLAILEQLAALHEKLRELRDTEKDSPEWRPIRDAAVKIRIGLVRAMTQEELLLEIPDVPAPPKKRRV